MTAEFVLFIAIIKLLSPRRLFDDKFVHFILPFAGGLSSQFSLSSPAGATAKKTPQQPQVPKLGTSKSPGKCAQKCT